MKQLRRTHEVVHDRPAQRYQAPVAAKNLIERAWAEQPGARPDCREIVRLLEPATARRRPRALSSCASTSAVAAAP